MKGNRPTACLFTAFAITALVAGCSTGDPEQRAREMAEKMKNSIPNVEQVAAQQKVAPEVVKKVQEDLTKLYEYMGPVTGDLDPVTINAIQDFQRQRDLVPNGLLNDKTVSELDKAAAAPPHAS
jgi:peptidoglycan hydrolase-like protein with peptidoglycan-binding domain